MPELYFLTRHFQPIDCQAFEQRRKPAGWLRPRQLKHPDSMFPAFRSRWPCMQDGLVLTGVQMPPFSFGLMIIQPTTFLALRTRPLLLLFVFQINVYFAVRKLQLHSLHEPRCFDPQNL